MKGLILGRFQPFHNGHLGMIKWCASRCDELVIGIGSSNKTRTFKNPFSYDEREFMIDNSINLKIPYEFVGIPDFGNGEKWIAWVDDNIKFDFLMSNSKPEIDIFRDYGFEVRQIEYENKEIRGTQIREMMLEQKDISKFVPPVVAKFVKDTNLKLIWV